MMNIGLVLSGGMAKGAYQVGALRALNEFIPKQEIKYLSCSSIGALNGYGYVTDNLDRVERMWRNVCTNDSRFFISQMLKSSMLQYNIADLCADQDQLSKKFYCSLLDVTNKNIIYKDLSEIDPESLPLYLKASVAMPIYNRAVHIGENAYFDGAMVDNIPVYPLMKHKLDYLICVYFDETHKRFENVHFDNKIIKITFPGDNVKQALFFDQESIDCMINRGYDRAAYIFKNVLSGGYEDAERVYHEILKRNSQDRTDGFRITGDVLVTNLNKITQKLTKRKIL